MKCRNLEELLAEGRPLTAQEEAHIRECEGCRLLVEAFNEPGDPISSERVRGVIGKLPQLTPTVPLPSDQTLIFVTLASFLVFCLLAAAFVRMWGYFAMTPLQRSIYYGLVTFVGLVFAMAAAQAAIPGAKVRVRSGRLAIASVIVLAVAVSALFPTFGFDRFVSRGVPCLRLGCICAALFALLATVLLKRGYVTNPGATSVLIGCFAGFSGVAVLSLHCQLLEAPHIIVWHFGAMAVSALGGLVIGRILQREHGFEGA